MRNGNDTASLLQSREGVTQGDPLAVVAYGIGFLPLIEQPNEVYPEVTQPWYADNMGALGTYGNIKLYI